jgi:hypothetical protein
MLTLPTWAAVIAFIVGPGSLLAVIILSLVYRKRDITDGIDAKNITSQKQYIATLEKDKIDGLERKILEIQTAAHEVTTIAETLKMFVPLVQDVENFKESHKVIIAKLDAIIKSHK